MISLAYFIHSRFRLLCDAEYLGHSTYIQIRYCSQRKWILALRIPEYARYSAHTHQLLGLAYSECARHTAHSMSAHWWLCFLPCRSRCEEPIHVSTLLHAEEQSVPLLGGSGEGYRRAPSLSPLNRCDGADCLSQPTPTPTCMSTRN